MAIPVGGKDPPVARRPALDETLREEPYRFGFFQAVRVLARMFPHRRPVGRDEPPGKEIVRFRAHLSTSFPPSEIFDLVVHDDDKRPPDLTVAFMGLTGPMGALPRFYTDLLLERARLKDHTLREFLDLFNHRLISLFYRAWEKNRFWTGFERAELAGQDKRAADPRQHRSFVLEERPKIDLFSQCLLDLAGLGIPTLRYRSTVEHELTRRTEIEDETLRFYSGLLAQQHRSAIALEGLLSDYFGLHVTILQFSGQWLYLEPENQSCLTEGGNIQMGVNLVVGERFWDMQGKFRIRLGPLTYRQFLDFLPLGTAFRPLAHLARLYAGKQFDVDVQVVLLAAEVPWCRLGDTVEAGARLGWNTWIRNHEMTHDATDPVFTVKD
jgi:type VI secretion system protein ImpH